MTSYEFTSEEVKSIRQKLLSWYDVNKRLLPWRQSAVLCNDVNNHAYAVWVSEVMLQQTRVATVIDYYNRWMKKWPNVKSLANAKEEDVNQLWSGLGYYSRGRRLLQGAIKVVKDLDGVMPQTAKQLMQELPGVGRYTAAAVASIVFLEPVGVLDGNVTRVLCRLRTIGGNSQSKEVVSLLWQLSDQIVDSQRPGDFNQAVMELGATVCVPKNPKCCSCPVKSLCKAYKQTKKIDSTFFKNKKKQKSLKSNDCTLNLNIKSDPDDEKDQLHVLSDIETCADHLALPVPWSSELGVMNYPYKPKKKPARMESVAVVMLEWIHSSENGSSAELGTLNETSKVLLFQRPSSGLLAGLWEFPSKMLTDLQVDFVKSKTKTIKRKKNYDSVKNIAFPCKQIQDLVMAHSDDVLKKLNILEMVKRRYVGEVVHIFSHIHQTNYVEHILIKSVNEKEIATPAPIIAKWVPPSDFCECAISSAVLKIFKKCHNNYNNAKRSITLPEKQAALKKLKS